MFRETYPQNLVKNFLYDKESHEHIHITFKLKPFRSFAYVSRVTTIHNYKKSINRDREQPFNFIFAIDGFSTTIFLLDFKTKFSTHYMENLRTLVNYFQYSNDCSLIRDLHLFQVYRWR